MNKLKLLFPLIVSLSLTSCSNIFNLFIPKTDSSSTIEDFSTSTSESKSESESSSSSSSTTNKDAYTILIYMCGSNLESEYGLASSDIQEILSLSCPDDVNIVIETGGSTRWGLCTYNNNGDVISRSNVYNISSTKLGRYHVEGKKLVTDASLTKASMGESSTLQSFITWGFNTYPAEQTGIILWNHGAAMGGCCSDDNYYGDTLTTAEVSSAVKGAMKSLGRNQKFTWIGYDCCLMSVADIASINSQYFDYMIASQESETGEDWDYDGWLPTLYNNTSISPKDLLPKICDTFVADFENAYGEYYANDQTLSVLDLSKMSNFITAFDNYVTALNINTSSKWSNVKTAYNNSLRFGYDEDYGYLYGVADFANFLTKMSNSFTASTSALSTALKDLVIYNKYGASGYTSTKPCGLNVFVAYAKNVTVDGGTYGLQCYKEDYSTSDTLFTNWRAVNQKYGF